MCVCDGGKWDFWNEVRMSKDPSEVALLSKDECGRENLLEEGTLGEEKRGSSKDKRELKSPALKVDNWGIYLLQRLESFYEKGDYADLRLHFPKRNASIEVHKLVMEASTDWLSTLGLVMDKGVVEMPPSLTPETVSPLVKFMYTGRLDLQEENFVQLRETAEMMRMSVLVKLMDDAKCRANEPPDKEKKNSFDPVKQIKRIKRIEKRFADGERRARLLAAKEKERAWEDLNRLPGKKLPIWKRRKTLLKGDEGSSNPTQPLMISSSSTSKKYSHSDPRKRNHSFSSKQVREMQQTLLFDQIRETASKKVQRSSLNISSFEESTKDMDGMKELLEEQRKRLSIQDEDCDDDYFDNEADLHYGEADDEDEDDAGSNIDNQVSNVLNSPSKSILKSNSAMSESPPLSIKKIVRFSLKSSVKDLHDLAKTNNDFCDNETIEFANLHHVSKKDFKLSIDKPQSSIDLPPLTTQCDYSTCAPPSTERSNNNIINIVSEKGDKDHVVAEVLKRNPNIFKDSQTVRLKVLTKNTEGQQLVQHITLKPSGKASSNSKASVLTKRAAEKRLRALRKLSHPVTDFKTVPKVMYTGRRGRPKKIKEGEFDPHETERKAIHDRLYKVSKSNENSPSYTTLQYVSLRRESLNTNSEEKVKSNSTSAVYESPIVVATSKPKMDVQPSSEAEAMSNVASDIAASINLVDASFDSEQNLTSEANENDTSLVVSSVNLLHPQVSQHMFVTQNGAPSGAQPVQILQTDSEGTILMAQAAMLVPSPPTTEPEIHKLHCGLSSTIERTKRPLVSALALDWNDEEEEDIENLKKST